MPRQATPSLDPSARDSADRSLLRWVLIMSGAGFAAGFFGPMIFAPDANQGPLVGILFSGPGGAVLGVLLWGLCKLLPASASVKRRAPWVCSLALAIVTLYFVMPPPALRGDIEEVQINSCKRPLAAIDDAVAYWNTRVASNSAGVRPGWKEDSGQMLQDDEGVILGVDIVRVRTLREEQKPWNKGHILASNWQPTGDQKSYYARYAGGSCSDYVIGAHAILFNDRFFDGVPTNLGGPPRKVANFLDLQTLEAIPNPYREFAGD